MELIHEKINEIINYAQQERNIELKKEQAFNYLTLQYLCYKNKDIDKIFNSIQECITDKVNDGGIDYVFFDDAEDKIIIGQNKFSTNITTKDFCSEINQIFTTLSDFEKMNTGKYNDNIKEILQNAIDRLSDENKGNIDIYFSTLSTFEDRISPALETQKVQLIDDIKYFSPVQLEEEIVRLEETSELVPEFNFKIDKAKNFLEYENDEHAGILVNISSKSLINAFNRFQNKGLLNLNIRRYIPNKTVDTGIKHTLDKDRENFWFLNNGLTIACEDYSVDGNKISIYNFSIVNGGQTTTLIGKYKGNNSKEFFIPSKLIKSKKNLGRDETINYFNQIAEATNSQKPIHPKDLKSNAPEMIRLQRLLKNEKIFLEIKRGIKSPNKEYYKLSNEILAQLIFSFVYQKPGTARSNKKTLFTNNTYYGKIFKNGFEKNDKYELLLDLIELNRRFDIIFEKIKNNKTAEKLSNEYKNIINNGKFAFFAIFGICYRLINKDIEFEDLIENPKIIEDLENYKYSRFIKNYTSDDIDQKLYSLIKFFLDYLVEMYNTLFEEGHVTSVSNLFKTEAKYMEIIKKIFQKVYYSTRNKPEFLEYAEIFKR